MPSTPHAAPRELTFAVIVPTYRRPAQLARCLRALEAQRFPRDRFEVVVVVDGEGAPPEGCGAARVIRQANAGPGAARNRGAAATSADFLAFVDDDCVPDPGWLAALAERAAADPECGFGGAVVNALDANPYAAASQLIVDLAYAHHNVDPAGATFFASNNLAFPAAAFRALGGFDAAFRTASEDRDLCARWVESGRRLTFVPEATIAHMHDLTLGGFARQHFAYGRGAWRFHAESRRRGRGRLARDLAFHRGFLAAARRRLHHAPPSRRVTLAALLALWQGANALGFAYEALRDRAVRPLARRVRPAVAG